MKRESKALSTHDITFIAASIALISVSAWITIPAGPVPFTLQTMALAFLVGVLSARRLMLTCVGYILLGACGLPLFSGMQGGFAVVLGPTGGFLLGIIPASLLAALITGSHSASSIRRWIAAYACDATMFVCGCLWLATSTHISLTAAAALAVAPFIIPDMCKVAAGVTAAQATMNALPTLAAQDGNTHS